MRDETGRVSRGGYIKGTAQPAGSGAFVTDYVRAALDAREDQGLTRHVQDDRALEQVQELLEPATASACGKAPAA